MKVGVDIDIGDPKLMNLSLVGRLCDKMVSEVVVRGWIMDHHVLSLGHELIFHLLPRRQLCFLFRSSEDVDIVMGHSWNWGPFGLFL